MKRIVAFLLVSVMLLCNHSVIYAANVVGSVTDTEQTVEETAETTESEKVDDVAAQQSEVSVGYIVESPTEDGKDVFIQLGTAEDSFINQQFLDMFNDLNGF